MLAIWVNDTCTPHMSPLLARVMESSSVVCRVDTEVVLALGCDACWLGIASTSRHETWSFKLCSIRQSSVMWTQSLHSNQSSARIWGGHFNIRSQSAVCSFIYLSRIKFISETFSLHNHIKTYRLIQINTFHRMSWDVVPDTCLPVTLSPCINIDWLKLNHHQQQI